MKTQITSKEVMLVAWRFAKIDKAASGEFDFGECLKSAWELAKNHLKSFLTELHAIVLRKRKETLKNLDIRTAFCAVPMGAHVSIEFSGEWWERYEWLFKMV